jgi:Domain of unknown function (DUF4516)
MSGVARKFGGGKSATGTPSLAWSSVVVVASLLSGASIVHNIYKPDLVSGDQYLSVAVFVYVSCSTKSLHEPVLFIFVFLNPIPVCRVIRLLCINIINTGKPDLISTCGFLFPQTSVQCSYMFDKMPPLWIICFKKNVGYILLQTLQPVESVEKGPGTK